MAQVDQIEEALQRLMGDVSPEVREAASEAFDAVRARRSVAGLLQELRTGSVEARIRAVYSGGQIGGQEGLGLLMAALDDADAEVRAVAARELSVFPAVPVLKAIVERLPKERGIVLGNLIETLGRSRRKELAPVVERYLADPDPFVKGKALVAYARTADAPWPRLVQAAVDGNDTVRAAAAQALGEWSEIAAAR
ncbi:MAG TPA: HEAT repeat domain-containing protein [Candidatus Deferrimicrobiaceae bacterium]|jgi:HEAT repeat protein